MPNLLHDLLRESAKKYTNKIAVTYRGRKITYGELDLASERLASCLINKGIKKNDRVGIYLDKTIDAIIAIFGILKSGACYVPLEPLGLAERQVLIINDCALEYLIASSKKLVQVNQILKNNNFLKYIFVMDDLREKNKEYFSGVDIVCQNEILESKISFPAHPREEIRDDNLAYIFYTSGSTGKPKGIMISHKASLAFINWAYECFDIRSHEKVSAHAPFYFDLSIFDIFVTVKAGATLCIVPQGVSAFPISLAEFIEKEKINNWYSVPSALIQLILHGNLESRNLSALKRILYAGEEFPKKYLQRLIKIVPHAKYYNLYGPTETNVCTCYPIKSLSLIEDSVPIGKPIKNVETFVIKENGAIANKGESGELYVSGPVLMDGYWHNPQKTKSVLFRSPFHSDRDKMIYKTGDLVKINDLNDYVFLGRRDNMIKSRGFRIQLEEIELVLNEHPKVKKAVAAAISDIVIGKRIKAIVTPKKENQLTKEAIKDFCLRKLPYYMVPEIIEFRKSLSQTSTKKINRRDLT